LLPVRTRNEAAVVEGAATAVSRLGTGGVIWVALAPLMKSDRASPVRVAATTAATTWGADLLALGLRSLVGRPRPCNSRVRVSYRECPTTPSFPSDHATTAFAGASILAWHRPEAGPALALLASAIAVSRAVLGVHHTSDVLAGAALGTACAVAAARMLDDGYAGGNDPAR
jgi:undecaprenyl-diphosphatase